MRSTRTSSSKCTEDNWTAHSATRAGGRLLVFALALTLSCSDRSYSGRAEQHLGALATAAVELFRAVEEDRSLDGALERYAREVQEMELFLHGQSTSAEKASYRKLTALLQRHKELLESVRKIGTVEVADHATAASEDDADSSRVAASWVSALNELLRQTGEVRSLLRQGN